MNWQAGKHTPWEDANYVDQMCMLGGHLKRSLILTAQHSERALCLAVSASGQISEMQRRQGSAHFGRMPIMLDRRRVASSKGRW